MDTWVLSTTVHRGIQLVLDWQGPRVLNVKLIRTIKYGQAVRRHDTRVGVTRRPLCTSTKYCLGVEIIGVC